MSKARQHAPTRRPNKKGTRKSPPNQDRAQIRFSEENQDALQKTKAWLHTEEREKLCGRWRAFEETLSKLQMTWARNGPVYRMQELHPEDVQHHIKWVDGFKGVMVKRLTLDVGKKKGKAWADQHRAQCLGKDFFVILFGALEKFVDEYCPHVPDMTREAFLHECIVAVLKKTFSPGHKQAGETPLICDQAIKSGPTRARLRKLLPNLPTWDRVKKGRDVVDRLEALSDDNLFGGFDDEEEDEDGDKPMDDESNSQTSDRTDTPTPPLPPETQPMRFHNPFQANWTTFPQMNPHELLRAENEMLKQELDRMRRQLVAQSMASSYGYEPRAVATPIPLIHQLNSGSEMFSTVVMRDGFSDSFALDPQPSRGQL